MRQPQRRPGVGTGVVGAFTMTVVVPGLEVVDPRGWQPVALVVGLEKLAVDADPHAVRGAQAAGDRFPGPRHGIDLQQRARPAGHRERRLRTGQVGGAAVAQRHRGGHPEEAVLVHQVEGELMVVEGRGPTVRHGFILVGNVVAIVVDEAGDLLLLGHVDHAVDDLQTERLAQAFRETVHRDRGRIVEMVEQVDRAGRVPGGHRQPAVGQEVEPADRRPEVRRAEIHQIEAGMHADQRPAVARTARSAALATRVVVAFQTRRGHVGLPVFRLQHAGRDGFERCRARRLPFQQQPRAAGVLIEVDVVAEGSRQQVQRGGRGGGARLVVVDHQRGLVAEEPLGTVVAGQAELVGTAGGNRQPAPGVADVVIGERSPVGGVPGTAEVDRLEVRGHRRRLAVDQHRQLAHFLAGLVEPHRHARF